MKPEQARYQFLHAVGTCAATGQQGEIHAAHIRSADSYFLKPVTGIGQKPHWVWTLPLCPEKHAEQHRTSEEAFWERHGFPWLDICRGPLAAALILEGFRQSNNVEGAARWLSLRAQGRL